MVIFAWIVLTLAALAATGAFLVLQYLAMATTGRITWEGVPLLMASCLLWWLVVCQFPFTMAVI